MRFRTFAGVALTMFAVPAAHAIAADPPKPCVTKVFSVGDLVVAPNTAPAEQSKRLMKTVTEMVRPYSWSENGGAGKIEFFDTGSSIVVTNSDDAVKEIADLLEAMRAITNAGKPMPVPVPAPTWTAPRPAAPQLAPAQPAAVPQLVTVPPAALRMPVPCALPVAAPVPVCCADGGLPRSSLDYLRKLAAAHAETGARATYMVKVRNVAAADVACAIQKHLGGKAGTCSVGADPATNTLIASGEPVQVRRALDLAAALDVAPPQVAVSGLVLTVSREFLETAGLSTAKSETAWCLSARETHMLTGLIRAAKANDKNFETLSRPQIQVCDKQTGFVQVGQDVVLASATETKVEGTTTIAVEKPVSRFVGINLRVTPKLAACGDAMALTVDSQFSKVAPGLGVDLGNGTKVPGINACSVQATASLKKGESFVLQAHGDRDTVTLVVLTPSAVTAPACPGWFTK